MKRLGIQMNHKPQQMNDQEQQMVNPHNLLIGRSLQLADGLPGSCIKHEPGQEAFYIVEHGSAVCDTDQPST